MSTIWYYCVLVVYVLGRDECVHRKAANRTNGFVTIADCKVTDTTKGTIVLLGAYVGDDVLTLGAKIRLENTTNSAGTSNDCLTIQLRPKFTGSTGWTQRVAYGVCGVDASKGYILLEYTCVAVVPDQQKLEFPPCQGSYNGNRIRIQNMGFPNVGVGAVSHSDHCECTINTASNMLYPLSNNTILVSDQQKLEIPKCQAKYNGSRIRIQNKGFPNLGVEAVTYPNHCECTINTAAKILNITTYYMDITDKQSLSIIDGKGDRYVSKNLSKDDAMRSHALNVSGPLILNWTNSETARNGSKFWLEVEANGTRIEVDCDPKTTTTTLSSSSSSTAATTTLSTKLLTSISAPIAKTDVNLPISVTSRTSIIPEQSENTVPNSIATSSSSLSELGSPTKSGSRLGVTPDEGHAMEAKSDLEDDGGSKFPFLPIVIGTVLLLVIVIICVAIAIYIKKKKAKQKVQNTDDKDVLADSNNDEDKTDTNSYEETVTNPSNTKFTAAATLIPATQFPPVSNQVPAVRSTSYDAFVQHIVREEEKNEITEERKKKKKKKKKQKRKRKNVVSPEEEWDVEPQILQKDTENSTLGDNIYDN